MAKGKVILDDSTTEKRCGVLVREPVYQKFAEYVSQHGAKVTAVAERIMMRVVEEDMLKSDLMGKGRK